MAGVSSMPRYNRPHHEVVNKLLNALNCELLSETKCYFGGGTRIVLELDEYRESLDIDFLCADKAGYRKLRSSISQNSLGAICSQELVLLRDVRADMYGIRTFFSLDDTPIKFEIIFEGRIPLAGEWIKNVPVESLGQVACFAEKLLANADRARDKSNNSRDLIDLAFMSATWPLNNLAEGLSLSEEAYGEVVLGELIFALDQFGNRAVRKSCLGNLNVSNPRKLDRGLNTLRRFSQSFE